MRMTTTALATIVIGGLFSFGTAAFAQPPESPPAPPEGRGAPPTPAPRAVPPQAQPLANVERPEPNVALEDLVRRVAAETGRTFLIDPLAPARIYVGGTIGGTPSYGVLLSILREHGLMAVEVEGVVHIVLDANARSLPTRIVQTDDDSIPDDEIVTRVLTLPDDVQAAQLVPILRPMMPQNAHLTALPRISPSSEAQGTNKLVIVDHYANVRRITEVIRLLVGSVSY
ncbi:MAG TPA: hypothetical protein VF339_20320 [Gammaproteobacteria bacterium]